MADQTKRGKTGASMNGTPVQVSHVSQRTAEIKAHRNRVSYLDRDLNSGGFRSETILTKRN